MAEEVLVKENLSAEMIDGGEELTNRLVEAGWSVTASFWLYLSDSLRWNLVFGIEQVVTEGSLKISSSIQVDLDARPIRGVSFLDVVVLQSDHPLIKRMRSLTKAGGQASRTRVTHAVVDNVFIEDVLIYPVPKRRRNAA